MKIRDPDKKPKKHVRVLVQLLDNKNHSLHGENIYVETTNYRKVYKAVRRTIKRLK